MNRLIELVAAGVSVGAIYALIAMGFVVIFRGTRVVNFAHGSLLLLGGYVVALTAPRAGFWMAAVAGILAAAAGALLIRLVMSRLRGPDPMALTMVTIGIDIVLTTELARRIGTDFLPMGDPWGSAVVKLGFITVPQARIAATLCTLLIIVVLFAVFTLTDWGVTMRAAADDPETASLVGIRLRRVSAASWLIGGSLAAVAAVFLAAFPAAGLDSHSGVVALAAIPAVIIGGFDSLPGALLGAMTVGLVESISNGYGSELSALGRGFGSVAPYLVMVAVLLWRPSGLFGTRELSRV